ncbi:MAG: tyrosine--tRNA ligase [Rhodothermales bacterium]|nr:tyrosine--tRNA ligase [Rhodothermales bacterium]MBO6779479.1 tyrosine--tRNA ligase [Rhodothermales bacterium]
MPPSGNLFQEYAWRGMVFDATPGLSDLLQRESLTAYIGFDPTASSLHIGSLLPIMCLARLQRFGHHPIAIVGGGTGMIGDPSGKTKERQLLNAAQVEENLAGIRSQLEPFLDFKAASNPARIVNNLDWLGSLGLIEFLRDTGKHFTVNYMMSKESVKRRLESEDGISYTEFTYMMLQAYDFLKLNEEYDCTLQLGGSDQWGNILAGTDLIRRVNGAKAHGLVFPLVTNSAGTKFGKTESGTVWLSADRTSPYRFYQFWLNTDDRDVVPYLKYFTWLTQAEVEELAAEVSANPGRREAQRRLAREVTEMVHGPDALAGAERASSVLFGGAMEELSVSQLLDVFEEAPSTEMERERFAGEGIGFLDLLTTAGLAKSNGEARRLVRSGGIYLNNNRISEESRSVTAGDCIEGRLLVLRKGKKNYRLIQVR